MQLDAVSRPTVVSFQRVFPAIRCIFNERARLSRSSISKNASARRNPITRTADWRLPASRTRARTERTGDRQPSAGEGKNNSLRASNRRGDSGSRLCAYIYIYDIYVCIDGPVERGWETFGGGGNELVKTNRKKYPFYFLSHVCVYKVYIHSAATPHIYV